MSPTFYSLTYTPPLIPRFFATALCLLQTRAGEIKQSKKLFRKQKLSNTSAVSSINLGSILICAICVTHLLLVCYLRALASTVSVKIRDGYE